MILQILSIGRTSNQLRWVKECGGNLLSFWGEFYKTLLSENRIFITFQNCAFCTFLISVFVNTTAMVVNSYTVQYMCVEVIIFNQIGALKGR